MSGFTYSAWPNVLDNKLWANRANDLREYLVLSRDTRLTSHVEPQLLTYVFSTPILSRSRPRMKMSSKKTSRICWAVYYQLGWPQLLRSLRATSLHVSSSLMTSDLGFCLSTFNFVLVGRMPMGQSKPGHDRMTRSQAFKADGDLAQKPRLLYTLREHRSRCSTKCPRHVHRRSVFVIW